MMIKPMETADELSGKAYVHCQAWKEAYAGLVDRAFLDDRTLEFSRQRALRAWQSHIATLVAKDGEKVVGFADFGPYRGDDLPDAGEVYAIYILKEYYGRGVGFALMKRALEAMAEYRRIVIWVLAGNERAIRFYTSCGYCFDGREQVIRLGKVLTEARMILNR